MKRTVIENSIRLRNGIGGNAVVGSSSSRELKRAEYGFLQIVFILQTVGIFYEFTCDCGIPVAVVKLGTKRNRRL